MTFLWSRDYIYRSNGGGGPMYARIISVKDGVAQMERWIGKTKRRSVIKFKLATSFLRSPQCGWRRDDQN